MELYSKEHIHFPFQKKPKTYKAPCEHHEHIHPIEDNVKALES